MKCVYIEVLAKFKFYEAKNQVGAQILSTFSRLGEFWRLTHQIPLVWRTADPRKVLRTGFDVRIA